MADYTYTIEVSEAPDGGCTARFSALPDSNTGYGSTPLEAVRALCEQIREWPIAGAETWLRTPAGVAVARRFVPGFEPGGSAAAGDN